ncbi:isoprenoid biosynthesis glyoxalase ElbB [Bacteroidales bacterium OttesenSCG-928-C03]|nr:isoprenoid biosynthesis glyoxalase ElbB [Bacteroidales bacterium OttesenSCG-928-E04]MDL2309131.1 isoprenoid biosynthesis glyoxalase ElbB [Bacteroidales bacterium OttesenSCG-928-C03]
MKKFAVIFCGCGHLDGSEIHEATMTLLAIDKLECSYTIFAPDLDQTQVVNHFTKEPVNEKRNMMVEAARIARGDIRPIAEYDPAQFDALVFPGGFGVAKNLFTYAFDGKNAKVNPDVERIIKETYAAKKPIGALCIAPVLIAKVLGNITITVGSDPQTIADVEAMGATHVITQQTEVIADKQNMIFSTPCYMLPATIADIAESAENLISSILENIQ